MLKVTFDIKGVEAIVANLKELRKELDDWRPVFRALLPTLAREAQRAIETQGASIGKSWAPLKLDTQKRKARSGSRSALIQTGKLMSMLGSATGGKRSLSKKRLQFGPAPRLRYAASQQFGSKRGVPARPFLDWTDTSRSAAIQLAQQHVDRILGKVG